MRFLFVVLALALCIALPAHAGHSPAKIFLRIHVQTTGTGLPDTQAHTVFLPPNGEPIQVRALPEVSERNLIAIEPRGTGTLLFFDHQGQINLDAVTAQNQGRLLVVLLDGYIIYAPIIDEQISNGQLLLPHALTPEALKLLKDVAAQNLRAETKD